MIKRYEDFDIFVTNKHGQLYVALGSIPSDHATVQLVPITIPSECAVRLENSQDRKGEVELADLGSRLFNTLLSGEIVSYWIARLNRVRRRPETGLRLRFSLPPGKLDEIPLELLCARTTPIVQFLALDTLTPVVRSLHHSGTVQERLITVPVRMLIASSTDDIDAVRRRWCEALTELIDSKRLLLEFLPLSEKSDADYAAWYQRLVHTGYPYDIVHVDGGARLLSIQDNDQERYDSHLPKLANLLAYNGVRVVTLQVRSRGDDRTPGSFHTFARQLVARGLPALMMARRLLDTDVATWFYRQVYTIWLEGKGTPIEYAISEARRSLYQQFGGVAPWWEPMLFIRRGADPSPRVEQDTEPFSVYLRRAAVLSECGQTDQAVTELEMAYQVAPDQACLPLARALVTQARSLEDQGDEDGAVEVCQRALEVCPAEQTAREIVTSIHLRRGNRALVRRDLTAALTAYRQAGDWLKIEEVEARQRRRQAVIRQIETEGVSIPSDPVAVERIDQCLSQGQEYVVDAEWQAALATFERGLEFYHPYERLVDPSDEWGPRYRQLWLGHLQAQAMLHLSEQQWNAATDILEILAQYDSELDVTAFLTQARSEQQLERRYAHLLVLVEQENWGEAIWLAESFAPTYQGSDGQLVIDIIKSVLYTWGKELEEENAGRAYYLLYELYLLDPAYKDVANRCAAIAFRNGTRQDAFTSWEQKVEWLERVIEIDHHHRSGRTRQMLDNARYNWAETLLEVDRAAAVAQLERIDPRYEESVEVRQVLADLYYQFIQEGRYVRSEQANLDAEAEARARLGIELWDRGDLPGAMEQLKALPAKAEVFPSILALTRVYVALGHEERKARRWQNALEWWQRALHISPNLIETLRWRIREARARLWIKHHTWEAGAAGVGFVLLLVVLVVLRSQGLIYLPTKTPTATPTATQALFPTSTTLPVSSQTVTPLPTEWTAKPLTSTPGIVTSTPTNISTPRPTGTATPKSSGTSTLTPVPTMKMPVVVQPQLSSPAPGADISKASQVTLEWTGSIRANQAFRVVLRHVATGYTIQSTDLQGSNWTTGLPAERYGEYRWLVVVIQNEAVVTRSDEEWHFWFDPIGSSGGSGEDKPTPSGRKATPTEPPVVDPTEPPS